MNIEKFLAQFLSSIGKECANFADVLRGPWIPEDSPDRGSLWTRGGDRTYVVMYVFESPTDMEWQVAIGIQGMETSPFVVPLHDFKLMYEELKPPLKLAKDDIPPVDVAVPKSVLEAKPEVKVIDEFNPLPPPTMMGNPGSGGISQQLIDRMSLPEELLQNEQPPAEGDKLAIRSKKKDPLGLNEPQPPREDPIPEETGPGTSLADL